MNTTILAILNRLDRALALPGDSETLRSRKVTAFLAGLAGVVTAALFACLYFLGDAPQLSWLYFLTFVWTTIGLIIVVVRPRYYYPVVLATSIYVTIHPWLVVMASGGVRSGLLAMMWALVGPAASLLLIGIRPALLNALIYIAMATIAILVDPTLTEINSSLPEWVRLVAGLLSAIIPGTMVLMISLYLFRQMERAQQQADALLHNILPDPIAAQLKQNPATIAEDYGDVTVLFADIVGFTHMSTAAAPCDIVELLNAVFSDFDELAERYGLEKIKTIGDAYMAVGGLQRAEGDHTEKIVAFAFDLLDAVKTYCGPNGEPIRLRIGIHHGPLVAGVIGRRRFIYDLWGDTVNIASRMESNGLADVIQVTAEVKERLNGKYEFEARGPIDIKGKGNMVTYLLRHAAA